MLNCCGCSAQAEEGGGRRSVLGAAQEAADAGRCLHHLEKILILMRIASHLLIFLSFLVSQSVLKHRWSVLYLLLSLAEDPRKPSSRVIIEFFFLLVMSGWNDEQKCICMSL